MKKTNKNRFLEKYIKSLFLDKFKMSIRHLNWELNSQLDKGVWRSREQSESEIKLKSHQYVHGS